LASKMPAPETKNTHMDVSGLHVVCSPLVCMTVTHLAYYCGWLKVLSITA
jgi:hypothetical protein